MAISSLSYGTKSTTDKLGRQGNERGAVSVILIVQVVSMVNAGSERPAEPWGIFMRVRI
jgi:hypothetical protein